MARVALDLGPDQVAWLEASREAAVAAEDELAYRVRRLYMAGSAHAFATGRLTVFQTLHRQARRRRCGASRSHRAGRDADAGSM